MKALIQQLDTLATVDFAQVSEKGEHQIHGTGFNETRQLENTPLHMRKHVERLFAAAFALIDCPFFDCNAAEMRSLVAYAKLTYLPLGEQVAQWENIRNNLDYEWLNKLTERAPSTPAKDWYHQAKQAFEIEVQKRATELASAVIKQQSQKKGQSQ